MGSVMLFKLCFLYIVMLFNDDFCLLWAHLMYNYVLRDLQIKLVELSYISTVCYMVTYLVVF